MTITVLKIDPRTRTISKVKLTQQPITQCRKIKKIGARLWLVSAQAEKFTMMGDTFYGVWYMDKIDNIAVASSMVIWGEGYA